MYKISFHSDEQISPSSFELNKKRKLQYELGLPLPKHKFRDRSSSFGQGSGNLDFMENSHKNVHEGMTGGLEQQEESVKDSNNFSGSYDTAMSSDIGGRSITSFPKNFYQDRPSTSSNSCNKNALYSLDSRSIKVTNDKGQPDLEDSCHFESQYKGLEDQHPGVGADGDYIISEFGKNSNDPSGEGNEETNLYSNDVTSNAFVLSSGRWSIGQDARLGARKPTIDQEFEQYFSMLML